MRFPSYCGDRDRRDSWGSWHPRSAFATLSSARGGTDRDGAGKPIPEVAEDLGVHPGTLHSWVSRARRNGSPSSDRPVAEPSPGGRLRESERAELERLRAEARDKGKRIRELGMECDVCKQFVAL